jgi:hypothetical protein
MLKQSVRHRPAALMSAAATRIRRLVALPCVSEPIQIFGMRFFNRVALTVAQSCIAFAAADGDAPARAMETERIIGAVGDHRRSAVAHMHIDVTPNDEPDNTRT